MILSITGSHGPTDKIVQRSGIIIKRAMQIVIKSGPRVIIRTSSQRNWEQGRSVWETSCWPTRAVSHASDSICHGFITRFLTGSESVPLMSILIGSSGINRLRKLGNYLNKTLLYKYIPFFFFCHVFSDAVMSWCSEGPMISSEKQEATGRYVSEDEWEQYRAIDYRIWLYLLQ